MGIGLLQGSGWSPPTPSGASPAQPGSLGRVCASGGSCQPSGWMETGAALAEGLSTHPGYAGFGGLGGQSKDTLSWLPPTATWGGPWLGLPLGPHGGHSSSDSSYQLRLCPFEGQALPNPLWPLSAYL